MKTNIGLFILTCMFTLNIQAQQRHRDKRYIRHSHLIEQIGKYQRDTLDTYFERNTYDRLFWNQQLCYIRQTPLSLCEGYHTLFTDYDSTGIAMRIIDPTYPEPILNDRKHYRCHWAIVNDRLLLVEAIRRTEDGFNERTLTPEEYRSLSELIGKRKRWKHKWDDKVNMEITLYSVTRKEPELVTLSVSPLGVLEATWFSGTIDMAFASQFEAIAKETYSDGMDMLLFLGRRQHAWADIPFTRLTFRKGKLVKQETIKPKKIK